MAMIWARTGGAWDGSIWDYWDGTQVTAYPYASPQSGDVVYLNNKNVTYNSTSISIGVGILRNDEYVDANVSIASGGVLNITTSNNNFTFTGNIYAIATILYASFNAYNYAIFVNGNIEAIGEILFSVINLRNYAGQNTPSVTGNIILQNANLWNHISANKSWLINGVITGDNLSNIITGTTTSTGTINGTCSCSNSNAIKTLTINGNCNVPLSNFLNGTTCNISGDVTIGDAGYINFTTLNLNKVKGTLTIGHNARCSATNLLFNGDLIEYYDDSNGFCGVTWSVSGGFTITSDNFQWKNISSPRTSKYIIVTNYDLANRQQYPAESDVKLGTDYAFDNLHGKLYPDYPQQAEVLNDVEYARYEVETNNLALYSNTLYLYNGSSWSTIPYLGETTTNVTDSTHSVDPDIDIEGVTTTATDGDIVKYGAYYYMWDDTNTIWVKTDYYYIGETTADISGGSTRNQLFIVGESMKGILQIPTSPSTSDIVTAIKNDSDLGGKINTTNTNVGNISTAVTTIDGKVDIIDTNVDTLLSRLTSVLTQRLGQSVTVEILQQILIAHLDN